MDIGEILELHVPRACSTPIWLSTPTPGRQDIYHRAGGTHEPEPEVFLWPEWGGDLKKPKGLEVRVPQPLKDAMLPPPPPPSQVGSTVSVLCHDGPDWVVFLARWVRGRALRDFHWTKRDDSVTQKGHFEELLDL